MRGGRTDGRVGGEDRGEHEGVADKQPHIARQLVGTAVVPPRRVQQALHRRIHRNRYLRDMGLAGEPI